jgi:GNAT superfamily N-acetyltransferase
VSSPSPTLVIRDARPEDAQIIAEFNRLLALETEDTRLDPPTVLVGVQKLLADRSKGRYLVAEIDGRVVGQLMHTREWSDWRNGDLWWIQSVYVHADHRGDGVFRALFSHLERLARETPGIVGFRLYVERHNEKAQSAYRRLGLGKTEYEVMERIWG